MAVNGSIPCDRWSCLIGAPLGGFDSHPFSRLIKTPQGYTGVEMAGTGECRICNGPLPLRARSLCSPKCQRRAKTDWQLQWQKANPEKHAPYTKLTRVRNPDLTRARRSADVGRTRALKYGSPHEPYSPHDLVAMLPAPCWLCGGSDGPMGWDHVTPLVKGGADALHNIRPAHGLCNVRKSTKEVI